MSECMNENADDESLNSAEWSNILFLNDEMSHNLLDIRVLRMEGTKLAQLTPCKSRTGISRLIFWMCKSTVRHLWHLSSGLQ